MLKEVLDCINEMMSGNVMEVIQPLGVTGAGVVCQVVDTVCNVLQVTKTNHSLSKVEVTVETPEGNKKKLEGKIQSLKELVANNEISEETITQMLIEEATKQINEIPVYLDGIIIYTDQEDGIDEEKWEAVEAYLGGEKQEEYPAYEEFQDYYFDGTEIAYEITNKYVWITIDQMYKNVRRDDIILSFIDEMNEFIIGHVHTFKSYIVY